MGRLTWKNPEDGRIHLYGENADVVGKLANYEDLEEQCIEENQCGLGEVLLKWKAFFDDIAELYDYRKAEEQGLLLRLPCKVGDTVWQIHTIPKSNRKIIAEVVADAFFIALCVLEGRFGKKVFLTREEAESALAEKGGV